MATIASNHNLFCTENKVFIVKGKQEDGFAQPVKVNTRLCETEPYILFRKYKASNTCFANAKGKLCSITNALNPTDKHLESLDSYLEKLSGDVRKPYLKVLRQRMEPSRKSEQPKVDNSLRSLENYLEKVICEAEPVNYANKDMQESICHSTTQDQGIEVDMLLRNRELKTADKLENEVDDFSIIGILVSINIAVFLFEIAAPVKHSNFELLSLPMVYGAKINTLILTGEWWRLVTPMFLHSGLLDISLGSGVLCTFGLQVSQEYGSFAFLLIYILGGVSGNLISFLHTPEPTVGGMEIWEKDGSSDREHDCKFGVLKLGPVFAVIGAWLIYQIQNKDVTEKDASDRMFQNAIVAAALSLVLSNFGPIDEWTHLAAAFSGIAYGYVIRPTLQVKDVSSEAGRGKRITLVRQCANPCKSLLVFSLFLVLFFSLLFVIEPPQDFNA